MKFFWLLVFLWLPLQTVVGKTRFDREITQKRRELKLLKKEVEEQRKEIDQLHAKEKGVLSQLELVKKDISKTLRYLKALDESKNLLDSSIVEKRREIELLEGSLGRTKSLLKQKIRKMYKKGHPEYGKMLLRAESSREILEDWVFMKRLMKHDQKLIEKYNGQMFELQIAKEELETRVTEVKSNEQQGIEERARLKEKQEKESEWLKNIQRDKELREVALQEYKAHQEILLSLIKDLEKKRKEEIKKQQKALASKQQKPPKKSKMGKACRPVEGKIVSEFGMQMHPVLKTKTRNLGVEIETKKDTRVRAAQPGNVAKIVQLPGRGLSVILDHGNSYYSVYGGLGQVFVRTGQKLKSCQEIATIAPVAKGKKPKLYFQVSKGVKTINPRDWIDE